MREGDTPKRCIPQRPAWVGPYTVKRGRREDLWTGQESKVSVDVGLKKLKVISRGEDGGWE